MPIKYIPYYPNTVEGQAILDNITRTRRILSYRENDKVFEKIKRGMPFYEVETVELVKTSEVLKTSEVSETPKNQNLIIRGECVSACAYLKDKGIKVDLVYIDPPFASGADYAKKIYLRRNPKLAEKIKQAEQEMEVEELRAFEEKMYGDIWKKEDYLNWMYENLQAIKSVMSDTASIYVHLDWNISHYIKIILDEIFGENNFQNNIVWCYKTRQFSKLHFNRKHHDIFWYSMNDDDYIYNWNVEEVREEYSEATKKKYKLHDENGYYRLCGRGIVGSPIQSAKDVDPIWEETHPELVVRDYYTEGFAPSDYWLIEIVNQAAHEREDYNTQKPEKLLRKVIKASSNEGMIVADFFGGSGVTAKVANDLGRKFIHCDVGVNSIQTTRDRLIEAGAEFQIMEIKDGVSLFRNPVQTMEKLAKLIPGLQQKIEGINKFWFGAIQNSKDGIIPVYVPNLLDSKEKVLDIPLINKIINQELQNLEVDAKKVVVYYIDVDDFQQIEKFIRDNNVTEIKVELKDLKNLLNEVVIEDIIGYDLSEKEGIFEIEITKFISDRLLQKISEFNEKGQLQAISKGKKFTPIEISEEGLELIELISLDCTNKAGIWQSDNEIKIDKNGFVRINGEKTKEFWDGKIRSEAMPLRMKIRNISGDESVVVLS